MRPLRAQAPPLEDAELLLFVDDREREVLEPDIFGKDRMRSHEELNRPIHEGTDERLPLLPPDRAGDELRPKAEGTEIFEDGFVVLPGEDFRGRH